MNTNTAIEKLEANLSRMKYIIYFSTILHATVGIPLAAATCYISTPILSKILTISGQAAVHAPSYITYIPKEVLIPALGISSIYAFATYITPKTLIDTYHFFFNTQKTKPRWYERFYPQKTSATISKTSKILNKIKEAPNTNKPLEIAPGESTKTTVFVRKEIAARIFSEENKAGLSYTIH
jgi:hypothetical protein